MSFPQEESKCIVLQTHSLTRGKDVFSGREKGKKGRGSTIPRFQMIRKREQGAKGSLPSAVLKGDVPERIGGSIETLKFLHTRF